MAVKMTEKAIFEKRRDHWKCYVLLGNTEKNVRINTGGGGRWFFAGANYRFVPQ